MIQLFAVKGACSLASHIIIHELQLPYALKLLEWKDKAGLEELKKHNPMRQVPTLITDEGYPLAEGIAILQYLLAQKPNSLFPEGGKERFKAFEWMSFLATALHKAFLPMFKPALYSDNESHFETIKKVGRNRLQKLLQITGERFAQGPYALGENFTIVDAYLFVILNWAPHFQIDLGPYPNLKTFTERLSQRPSVIAAKKAEGLVL